MESTYIEQVNEYYKLKSKYESLIEKDKKKESPQSEDIHRLILYQEHSLV